MSKVLHLVTQDNQPYGSVRVCCERCGAYGDMEYHTDDRETFRNPPDGYVSCSSVRLTALLEDLNDG